MSFDNMDIFDSMNCSYFIVIDFNNNIIILIISFSIFWN